MASSGRSLHKLFIGNLPWTVGHLELRNYFKEFGRVVSANVIFDKKTGLSKGYGFITYANSAVLEVIESRTKHVIDGQNITVQKSS